jgi:SCY1-like protein 2
VEAEHSQHLRDVRRIEQQTASFVDGLTNGTSSTFHTNGGDVDFETLVKGGASGVPNPLAPPVAVLDPWDEGWADRGDADTTLVSLKTQRC